ncbi:hypothetical protein E2562_005192 [Oryza meyeriana var. granulata]|uniref:Uncharacterized protein n=1 Tax=Oryza meyeriana var. granulata TaxID=110450 RepID=A0A6G1BTN2_9ORYZ|nr:hypothetical protein E2562_005192 [Oryza meyeriana var. granulata]
MSAVELELVADLHQLEEELEAMGMNGGGGASRSMAKVEFLHAACLMLGNLRRTYRSPEPQLAGNRAAHWRSRSPVELLPSP